MARSDDVQVGRPRRSRPVREILLDGARTSARLVVNPAAVVVRETRRSFAYLSLYGIATDAVLVNRVMPKEASGGYFSRWAERERAELAAIHESFPVAVHEVSLQPREVIGPAALAELLSRRLDDNFTIPMSAGVGAWLGMVALGLRGLPL